MQVRLVMLVIALTVGEGLAGVRVFRDATGRKITAELTEVVGDQVTLKRKDGRVFTISLETLSDDDQAVVTKWADELEAVAAARAGESEKQRLAAERREKIAAFCLEKKGTQVGNGECWTLANDAFKASGATRPGGENRVWGRVIDIKSEPIEPGDVVEFRAAKISGYGTTGPAHTAVAVEGGRRGRCTLAEQNWSGNKTVRIKEIDLRQLESGEVLVYRLE